MTAPTNGGHAGAAPGAEQPQSPRKEAERLVASVLGAAAVAIQGAQARRQLRDLADRVLGPQWFGGADAEADDAPKAHGFATGSAECCVCPICRVVAILRDPSPEFAERLATGAGDLAAGVTGIMRAFGEAFGGATAGADGWGSATRGSPAEGPGARPPGQRKPMAKKAVKKAAPPAPADAPADEA